MNYYAFQVFTRKEERYLRLARVYLDIAVPGWERVGRLLWPRRTLTIRRRGKTREELAPVFPGYLFFEAEELPIDIYWTLRRTGGFVRFLKSNQQVEPLEGDDRRLLLHFLRHGEVVRKSTVTFDTNNRIQVVEGPMKGLEGQVVKVDRRKKRAKIKLELYDDSFLVDFGFEFLQKMKENDAQE
jgi:transcriptional antiterminator NusG